MIFFSNAGLKKNHRPFVSFSLFKDLMFRFSFSHSAFYVLKSHVILRDVIDNAVKKKNTKKMPRGIFLARVLCVYQSKNAFKMMSSPQVSPAELSLARFPICIGIVA